MATQRKTTGSGAAKQGARKSATKSSGSDTADTESTTKKVTRKKSAGSRTASAPRAEPARKRTGPQIAESAVQQLAELTSKEIEAVTGLEKTDDGWRVEVEVLELRRVPNTTDVLALYEVLVDSDGDLEGYQRRHRFVRGAPEDGAR
jgi:hypothetical protein